VKLLIGLFFRSEFLEPLRDGSSNSEDLLPSGELGRTEVGELDDRVNSWSFQAEIRLDLSGAGSNPSALIDLVKQVITESLCYKHHHPCHNLHMS
jgi:hypothetical protein